MRRIFLECEGAGGTLIDLNPTHGTHPDMQDRMTQLLAGRAAERLVLADVSAGAGGTPDSDLGQATTIATAIHRQYGLGIHGPVWLGPSGKLNPHDGDILARVRREIERAERRATQILAANRELLEEMAEALAASRDIGEPEAGVWLARVTRGVEGEAGPGDEGPRPEGPKSEERKEAGSRDRPPAKTERTKNRSFDGGPCSPPTSFPQIKYKKREGEGRSLHHGQ